MNDRGQFVLSVLAALLAAFAFCRASQAQEAEAAPKKIAIITNWYGIYQHGDVIGTKFLVGFPCDEGLVAPQVKVASIYIDQPEDNDAGHQLAAKFGIPIYPTIAGALTLGGEKLAVDGVLYIGEAGNYPTSRLGAALYPHLNHMDQIFRVFDVSDRAVPVYCDKRLSDTWLDSKWIYDKAADLNVPMMGGSCVPVVWRDPPLEHPIGAKITEAAAVGIADFWGLDIHIAEALQCMVERRQGGETGVASVQCLSGQAVWDAAKEGKFSMDVVEAACAAVKRKRPGTLQDNEKEPTAILVNYRDGTKGVMFFAGAYVGERFAYAARVDGKIVACEFKTAGAPPFAHFSYLGRNIEKMMITGKPQFPIERTLLACGVLDAARRSRQAGGVLVETPHLDVKYQPYAFEPIRPTNPEPTGASLGPWPPEELESIYRK